MKDFLTGGILGVPSAAILLLLGLLGVFAMQQLGVDPTVYKLTALGLALSCLGLYIYSFVADKSKRS